MGNQDRVEKNLLQFFVHPKTSEWFSITSVNIIEDYVVSEQKQAYFGIIFCFYIRFHCPQLFYCPTALPLFRHPCLCSEYTSKRIH